MAVVRSAKYLPELLDMFWIVKIDIRIAEVQLESGFEVRIARTAIDLGQGVIPERIDPANA
jgi:hypothetical protein